MKPWISNSLLVMMRKRDFLRKSCIKLPKNITLKEYYDNYRMFVKKCISEQQVIIILVKISTF